MLIDSGIGIVMQLPTSFSAAYTAFSGRIQAQVRNLCFCIPMRQYFQGALHEFR